MMYPVIKSKKILQDPKMDFLKDNLMSFRLYYSH